MELSKAMPASTIPEEKSPIWRLLLRASLLWILAAIVLLVGCTRKKDRFWPDTTNGQIQLTDPIIKKGSPDVILKHKMVDHAGEMAAIRRLTGRLPVGSKVMVSISVPTYGEYREGGGWIFKGRKYVGHYGISAKLVSVASSHPKVVQASVTEWGHLELIGLSPGNSTLTLVAVESKYADRPPNPKQFEDTIEFTVEP